MRLIQPQLCRASFAGQARTLGQLREIIAFKSKLDGWDARIDQQGQTELSAAIARKQATWSDAATLYYFFAGFGMQSFD